MAVTPAASVACTLKLRGLTAALFGMPLMIPVVENSVRPVGSVPLGIDQVTGAVPPEIAKVALCGTLTTPEGSEVVPTTGGPAMEIVKGCGAAVAAAASPTVMVKLYPPVALGMPPSKPLTGSSVKPGGSVADATVQPP